MLIEVTQMLEYIIVLATVVVLSIASYTDIKKRTIPNWLVYPAIAVGVSTNAVEGLIARDLTIMVSGAVGAGMLFGFGYIMWYVGLLGGGDVRLFAALGALLPNIGSPPMFQFMVSPVLVICVGGVLSSAYAVSSKYEGDEFTLSKFKNRSPTAPFMLIGLLTILSLIYLF